MPEGCLQGLRHVILTISSPSGRRAVVVVSVVLAFVCVMVPQTQLYPLHDMCGLGPEWKCPRNVDIVPVEVGQVCDMCGEFWGYRLGVSYCCRCDDRIFSACMEAVYGVYG